MIDRLLITNTFTLGGVLSFMMNLTPIITVLVLTTALILNTFHIIDWFKKRKNGKN